MRFLVPLLTACMACPASANDVAAHLFDQKGNYQPAGWPDLPTKLLVLAEKPLRLDFPGLAADWQPVVRLHRVTSARRIPLEAPAAEANAGGWQWTWKPPATRGPAHYEVRFEGEPERVVRIETRAPEWLKATLEMLVQQMVWEASGLNAEEHAALNDLGLQTGRAQADGKNETASLIMRPHQGDAARRRVVWDGENTALLVWRPGPSAGDLEVRAPRWWISPEALATDHGLIRFLDLFSEPPLNP